MSKEILDDENKLKVTWYCKDEKGNGVSTFVPRVLHRVKVEGEANDKYYVCLELCFENGGNVRKMVPLSEIDQVDWYSLDERCIVNACLRNAGKYLGNLVRADLVGAKTEVRYGLERLGIHCVNEKVVFVAGDRVITQSRNKNLPSDFEIAKLPFNLDIDLNLSGQETFAGMRELISLSPEIGRVLVAHVISGITRAAFKKAGLTPCAVLVVVGESGMLKSHYVPHMVQLYNRNNEIRADTRFNSTKRFIEDILFEFCECTAVIDDLHSAESKSIKRANENTAEEIIRRVSDDTGRGYKAGKETVQKSFRGNLVYIGEYMIGKESTVPRSLIVNLTKRPNGQVLDKYQRKQPLLVSTFYYFFIQWYVDHFEEICNEIDGRLTDFRATIANSDIHGRLWETRFYLQVSYMFFLQFCKDSGFIQSEDAVKEYQSFERQLVGLIQEQQKRFVENRGNSKELDYLKIISNLYRNKKICLADSVEKYNPDKHDGLIYYDCLCVRRKNLEKLLKKFFRDIQIDDVIRALDEKKALKRVQDKRTVKISVLNKKVGSIRFYAIWLHMLD